MGKRILIGCYEVPGYDGASMACYTLFKTMQKDGFDVAYVAGSFIPLGPYMIFSGAQTALMFSVVVTLVALTAFGYLKG